MAALYKLSGPAVRAFLRASLSFSPRASAIQRSISLESAGDIQNPPKRPPNAYVLFLKEKISEVRHSEPEMSLKEILRQFGSMWTNMSENDKEQYRELYAMQKKQWKSEYDAFLEELPNKDEYLKQLKAQRGERRQNLKKFREKKRNKLTKPPRKLSAYNLYMRDQLAGVQKEDVAIRFKEAAQSWKTMSEEEKKKYVQEAAHIHDLQMEEYQSRNPDQEIQD